MTSTNLGVMPTWPGSRYTPLEKLAVGGMGEIFLARDNALDRKVVIKVLLDSLTSDPEYVAMFMDEARAVARCEHPHIVKIFDVGQEGGRYFMALEYLQGWDLGRIFRRARALKRAVPVPITLRLLIDAALGLHAAHSATTTDGHALGLVHRDVTPNNLFVTQEGVLKVLDFGVAKTKVQRHATFVGQVKGKITYMSPEQCRGEPLDRRTDIFALGTVLYELVTGDRLFKRKTPAEVFTAIVHDAIPPPTAHGEQLDERLVRVMTRVLQRDRELRLPTAQALADELTAVLKTVYVEPARGDIAAWISELFSGYSGEHEDTTYERPAISSGARQEAPHDGGVSEVRAPRDTAIDARTSVKTSATVEVSNGAALGVVVPRRSLDRRLVVGGAAAGVLVVTAFLLFGRSSDEAPVTPPSVGSPAPAATASKSPTSPPASRKHERGAAKLPELAGDPAVEHAAAAREAEAARARAKAEDERGAKRKPVVTKAPERKPPIAPPPAASPGTGKLTLQSVPWANVYIDGELIGPTPIIEHELSAKSIKVRLVNPELGLEHNEVIAIRPGKITKRRVELASGAAHVSP